MMNSRENKGLAIASNSEITREGNIWTVPSQSSSKRYAVDLFLNKCSCPDFAENAQRCKHLHAIEFLLQRESGLELPADEPRRTYPQKWHEYNLAQTNEKARFLELLHGLCAGVEEPVQTFGRPRLPLSEMLFCAAFKVYSTISGRRFISDLRDALTKGFISKVPHFNSVSNYLEDEALTPYLKAMIEESARPLAAVEWDFAVDSSGFATGQYQRWVTAKYGAAKFIDKESWIKVHLMCGVKTNIVTSVESDARARGRQSAVCASGGNYLAQLPDPECSG